MPFHPTVSIIINTDGRAESLKSTLESLRYLDYPFFEVCTVYGPTPDGTKQLLEQRGSEIKVAFCSTRNVAASRNIGLGLAAGEIVAFLDDDSIPVAEWLSSIVAPFVEPDVAASGGFLLETSGIGYQWRFGTVDRLGTPDMSWDRPPLECNFPYTANVPHVMANSAFRKRAIVSIGGFDEQYEYYLDETDLVCRLVDCGWRIVPIEGAAIYHRFMPSPIRDGRVIKSWYAIVKSKIYFSLVNSRGHHDLLKALRTTLDYVGQLGSDLEGHIADGHASEADRARFGTEVDRALEDGLKAGFARARLLPDRDKLNGSGQSFLPFKVLVPDGGRRAFCLLSQTYPPGSIGGIGRHVHQLARSLAQMGHHVHVITFAVAQDTVDFEEGVWVHRSLPKPHTAPAAIDGFAVPQRIWDQSATMLSVVKGIATSRPVDAVFAPSWDCEGIAFLLDGRLRLVTSLYTPLKQWLDSHQRYAADKSFMESFARPMLAYERMLFQRSDGVLADGEAIVAEVESSYGIRFDPNKLGVVHLGLEDWAALPSEEPEALPEGALRLLFVGRLEERKGIDVFLAALKTIMGAHANVHVDIVGGDKLIGAHGNPYRDAFVSEADTAAIRDRVRFRGEVSDQALRGLYRSCDIFAAPSRFESFGLILLEAMMFEKAVIGCRAGGMKEIVEHGVSGLLAEPGDVSSLVDCLHRLIGDPQLRAQLGRAARLRYQTMFAPELMARRTLDFIARLPVKVSPQPVSTLRAAKPFGERKTDAFVASAKAPITSSERRVALINGIIVRNDAVSASVRDTYLMLASDPTLHTSVFAYANDFPDVACKIVRDSAELMLEPGFLDADLIIWHFATYYELFNAALIGNGKARQVVVYHNITPKEHLSEAAWPQIDRALRQRHHLRYVDEIWNVSAINAQSARIVGVEDQRNRVIALSVDAPPLRALSQKARSPIDILFVGRFVKSKGVIELIEAIAELPRGRTPVRLTLVGNLDFSDPSYVDTLHKAIAAHGLSRDVMWRGAVDDESRDRLYHSAHILAIPSYHEGFCKPVIEGLRAGCIPVGYASHNLPHIANGFGRMVRQGDVAALTGALDELVRSLPDALAAPDQTRIAFDRGSLTVHEFDGAVRDYVELFAPARIGGQMLARVSDLLGLNNTSGAS